jgi:hypothetical protein
MKNKSLLLGALLVVVVSVSIGAALNSGSPTKWQYKVVGGYLKPGVGGGNDLEPQLRSAGEEGWEAVSWASTNGNNPPYMRVLLKRPGN